MHSHVFYIMDESIFSHILVKSAFYPSQHFSCIPIFIPSHLSSYLDNFMPSVLITNLFLSAITLGSSRKITFPITIYQKIGIWIIKSSHFIHICFSCQPLMPLFFKYSVRIYNMSHSVPRSRDTMVSKTNIVSDTRDYKTCYYIL